jgi:hypothetical protein
MVLPRPRARQVVAFTYQTPYENLQGTPTNLPAAEPGTAQVAWTVAAGDLPTYSQNLLSIQWVGCLWPAGKNTDTSTRTIYWRMKKNGSSVTTGNFTVAASYYWMINAFFLNVAVNDLLEIALWADVADMVNWDYHAYQVHISSPKAYGKSEVFKNTVFTLAGYPTLSLGNPYSAGNYGWRVFLQSGGSGVVLIGSGIQTVPYMVEDATYGFGIPPGFGTGTPTSSGVVTGTSATYRPYYRGNYLPTQLIVRNYGELT